MAEQIEPREMTKDQLKLVVLTQRIGEITSKYEEQIADNRAEYTQQFAAMQDVLHKQEADIEKLQAQLRKSNESVQKEDPETSN